MESLFSQPVRCPHCGKKFIPRRIKCCKNCGKEFFYELGPGGGTPPHFCSDNCRKLYAISRIKIYNRKRYWKDSLPNKINSRITYLKSMLENEKLEITEGPKNAINKEIQDLTDQLKIITEKGIPKQKSHLRSK